MITGLLLILFYLLAGQLSALFIPTQQYFPAIFLPAGIALASLYTFGYRSLLWLIPAIAIHNLLLYQAHGYLPIILFTFSAILQSCLGAYLCHKFCGPNLTLNKPVQIYYFLSITLICNLLESSLNTLTANQLQLLPPGQWLSNFLQVWISNTLGIMLVFPCTMCWIQKNQPMWHARKKNVMLFFCGSIGLLALWNDLINKYEAQNLQDPFFLRSQQFVEKLQNRLKTYELTLEGLHNTLALAPDSQLSFFKKNTHPILQKLPAIQSIMWAPYSTNTTQTELYLVRYSESQPHFSTMEGVNLAGNNEQQKHISIAQKSGMLVALPPTTAQKPYLVQLIHRINQGPYAPGLLAVTLDLREFIKSQLPDNNIYEINLLDTQSQALLYGDKWVNYTLNVFSNPLQYGNREYHIYIRPNQNYLQQHTVFSSWYSLAIFSLCIICAEIFLLLLTAYRFNLQQQNLAEPSEQVLDNLIAKLPYACLICTDSERITFANDEAYKVLQLSENTLKDRAIGEVFPSVTPEAETHICEETIHSRPYRLYRVPFHFAATQWTLYVLQESNLNLLLESEQFKQKIGEIVATRTQQLQTANDEATRLANIKGTFLANMSHEIRTPMNAILGMVQIGLRGSHDEKALRLFRQMSDSGQLLLGIINDILDFSKIEANKLIIESETISLRRIVSHLRTLIEERIHNKGLIFRVHQANNVPEWIAGDFLRISQILLNLLSNAMKFTSAGEIVFCIEKREEKLVFRVSDTGIGMTDEQMARLFNPFEQADSSITHKFGGTGLGLAISKRLAELMGAEIIVSSTPNVGSSFELIMPLIIADAATIHDSSGEDTLLAPQNNLPRLQGFRILAAEDNPVNQMVLEDMFMLECATLVCADNGLQALEQLQHDGADSYDLVLTDIQMPWMDGYQLAQHIRQLYPELPVIGLTAHAMTEERNRCFECGMAAYLSKPVDLEKLVQSIRAHARRSVINIQSTD